MRAASSGSLVPAMGLPDGEGAGDTARAEAAEWAGSGEEEATLVVVSITLDVGVFLSSGVADLRDSFTLSRGTGEEVRLSSLAGVLALLGRDLGVEGLPRVDGGLGEAAGLGEAVLPFGVAGDAGRCLDKGLGLGSGLCLILGRDCLFFNTFS